MKSLERIYPWLLLAPGVLPMVLWSGVLYPYLVPKTLFFYAISPVTLGVFGVLVTHGHAFYWSRLKRWEAWIPGALLVLAYGTSYVGTDFYRSFWSLFIRGDGLLMLSGAVLSFYCIVLSADRVFFKRLLLLTASVGSLVAVYGIGEWLIEGGRIGGLLGNAAFFAGYLGIAVFATLGATKFLTGWGRRSASIGAGLQVVAIVLTATRGTLLALLAAGGVALVYVAYAGRGKQKKVATGSILLLLLLGGLFVTFRSELAHVPFTPIARVASISLAESDVASRLFIWKNMLGEVAKSPWIGVGAENINVLFNRFYDPSQIYEQWFDRSHNAFLDYTAQYGIGGLLLYLALISAFFTTAWRFFQRKESYYAAITALLAVTYTVQNFFVFDTISSFWLILALLAALFSMSLGDVPSRVFPLPAWTRYASWVVGGLLVLLIIPVSVRPFQAAQYLAQAYTYQLVDVPQEVALLSRGFALDTYGDLEYGYEVYDMYANNQSSILTDQASVDAYQTALSIVTTDFNRYPYDARIALYLAHILSLAPAGVSIDQNLLASALERAIRLSPKRAQPWYILANISISDANRHPAGSRERAAGYAAARDLLSRYIELVPTLSAPHFVLAQLLSASGLAAEAQSETAKGKQYYVEDLETASRAARYYETVLDLPNAAYFLAEVVRLDPTNTAAKSDLEKIQAYESR